MGSIGFGSCVWWVSEESRTTSMYQVRVVESKVVLHTEKVEWEEYNYFNIVCGEFGEPVCHQGRDIS